MLNINPQQCHHHHRQPHYNENGYMILAGIFGMGFIFSVLALVCALIALCR